MGSLDSTKLRQLPGANLVEWLLMLLLIMLLVVLVVLLQLWLPLVSLKALPPLMIDAEVNIAGPGTVAEGIDKARGAAVTRARPRLPPPPPPFRLDEGVLDVEFERRLRSPPCPEDEDEEAEDKEDEMEAEEDMHVFSSPPD